MNEKGCWIFISHSSQDIEKIRFIRNEFEKYGQNPLAFHLKCLSTDTEGGRQELDSLIRREIDARDWFVYCESEAARSSSYVQMERTYVESIHNKKLIWHINLDDSMEKIREQIRVISTNLQVYIAYSHADTLLLEKIALILENRGFQVWSDRKLIGSINFLDQIESKISTIAKKGFFLLLITKNTNLERLDLEYNSAYQNNAVIIVLIFEGALTKAAAAQRYKTINIYAVPFIPHDEDMHLITNLVLAGLEHKILGAIETKAKVLDFESNLQVALNYENRVHRQPARFVKALGAVDDYCEVYEFPCCGTVVLTGDGEGISPHRADGCSFEHKKSN